LCTDTARVAAESWRQISYPRVVAQAVCRVQSQVRSCEICGGQSGTGTDSLQVLPFPLPVLIPSAAPYSSVIRSWYNSGSSLTPSHEVIKARYLICNKSEPRILFFKD
jgi:hypothetical protein